LERLGWRFIRVRGSEFFRDPERALFPMYERLERMGIEPMSSNAPPTDTELSKRVIAEGRQIRTAWETEPDIIDEILGRTRPRYETDVPTEDPVQEEIETPLTTLFR